jgi:predicted nucleotidyltransferase
MAATATGERTRQRVSLIVPKRKGQRLERPIYDEEPRIRCILGSTLTNRCVYK